MSRASFLFRALLALGFLVGFYLVTIALSLALFVFPVALAIGAHYFSTWLLLAFAICWVPAVLLLTGVFGVRPRPFTAPGPRLERTDAPELFALIDALAARAETAPPVHVHLSPRPDLAVTETGGLFGGKRVLIIGLPLLEMITVQELSAGLAHELGHFAGGDTRLGGVLAYTTATFAAVFHAVQRGAFRQGTSHVSIELGFAVAKGVGELLTKAYAGLYFRVMSASSRRQELAADALAARLAGRAATLRLLDKAAHVHPTYDLYLRGDVGFAVTAGAMPTDLLPGYRAFLASFQASPLAVLLAEKQRAAKTSAFDSHPAHTVRVEKLRALPEAPAADDMRPATALLAEPGTWQSWLLDATVSAFGTERSLTRLPWAEIPSSVYLPLLKERARKLAAQLFALFPEATTVAAMFVAVVHAFERGESERVVAAVVPDLGRAAPAERASAVSQLGGIVLGTLFEGALVERGGTVETSFGAPSLVVQFEGERIPAAKIARDAMGNDGARAMLATWASRVASARVTSEPLARLEG